MKLIVKFTFTLILISNLCHAQFTTHHDSIKWVRSVRFGCDISRFILTQLEPGQKGFEVSAEVRATPNLYPTVELGMENVSFQNDIISQKASGQYGRIGVDYNLRNYVKDFSNNTIFFGLRYGFCNVNYQMDNYTIKNSYWQDESSSIGRTNCNAQWIEAAAGVKVEIIKNIYLGWSLRGKILLTKTQNATFPYIIPGYGPGVNNTNVGVNYSLYFQIPLMKMKTKYKEKKKLPQEETPKTTPNNNSQPPTNQTGAR